MVVVVVLVLAVVFFFQLGPSLFGMGNLIFPIFAAFACEGLLKKFPCPAPAGVHLFSGALILFNCAAGKGLLEMVASNE